MTAVSGGRIGSSSRLGLMDWGRRKPRHVIGEVIRATRARCTVAVHNAVTVAMLQALLPLRPDPRHTLQHGLATQLPSDGTTSRTVPETIASKSVAATPVYTHVLGKRFAGARSPLA